MKVSAISQRAPGMCVASAAPPGRVRMPEEKNQGCLIDANSGPPHQSGY
jgi:hypothetical protein